jgi:hypothetical protein
MVSQAILITVYKDPAQVLDIINFFDEGFEFYVHLDKSVVLHKEWLEVKNHQKVVHFRHTYKSYWGSWNILAASLELLNEAIKSNAHFFHLISGQDFPTKSVEDFKSFFSPDNDEIYIETFPLPDARWEEGGYSRLNRYYLNSFMNARKFPSFMKFWHQMQRQSGYRRTAWKKFNPYFGGSGWWSIPRNAAEFICAQSNNNSKFFNSLKYCLCPEEIYIPSLLMKSEFEKNIRPSVRYIKWEAAGGGSPQNLRIGDYESIKISGSFFARKFDNESMSLKEKLLLQLTN